MLKIIWAVKKLRISRNSHHMNQGDIDEGFRVLGNIYDVPKGNARALAEQAKPRLSNETEELLLPHQYLHVMNIMAALNDKNNNSVLDGSYTGTGKTYTTAAVCREMDRRPFVVCLKSNINVWRRVLELFGVEPIGVVNYELIRTGKYYISTPEEKSVDDESDDKPTKRKQGQIRIVDKIVDCPYTTRDKSKFSWNFDEFGKKNVLMIFDEVHACKNKSTLNSRLLLSCRSIKTLMLSATLCDKAEDFGIFGYMMGYYGSIAAGKPWLENIMRRQKRQITHPTDPVKNNTNILHDQIFNSVDSKGSKMSYEDMGSDMKDRIEIECYTVSPSAVEKIDNLYGEIRACKDRRDALEQKIMNAKCAPKSNADVESATVQLYRVRRSNAINEIVFKREKIENIKAEIMYEQAKSYYESRMSVVLFVNFRSTHESLCKYFGKDDIACSVIHGEQTMNERDKQITAFQDNEVRIMISMIQAGGSSVSLHDVSGLVPRVALISPSYSVTELVQALGRIKRSGSKSPTIQKIVYCAQTCEENMARIISHKEEIMSLMTGNKKILTSTAFSNAKSRKVDFTRESEPNKKHTVRVAKSDDLDRSRKNSRSQGMYRNKTEYHAQEGNTAQPVRHQHQYSRPARAVVSSRAIREDKHERARDDEITRLEMFRQEQELMNLTSRVKESAKINTTAKRTKAKASASAKRPIARVVRSTRIV